jgi:hypothetical protein
LGLPDNSIPYWAKFEDQQDRNKAIEVYSLQKELGQALSENSSLERKIKL